MISPFLPTRWLISSADTVDDPTIFPLLIGQTLLTAKAPQWRTSIATASSGRERRQQRWSYPRWTFQLAYEVLRQQPGADDLGKLWAFFNMHAGPAGEFGYLDPTDCTVDNQVFGMGDGTTDAFRLTRTMAFGGIRFTEPVRQVIGIPAVTVDGVEAAVTIGDDATVEFDTPPGSGAVLRWTGRFAFRVRFLNEQLEAEQMMKTLWSSAGLQLISLKG
jgi:uncharacterized protein (TIGR02217 family)